MCWGHPLGERLGAGKGGQVGQWVWGAAGRGEAGGLARSPHHPYGVLESGACGLGFPWSRVGEALAQWIV